MRSFPTAAISLLLGLSAPRFRTADAAAAGPEMPAPASATFFVAPEGKDTWSGRKAAPAGDDGPFATVARARDAVRALRAKETPKAPVIVLLRGGTYFLDAPLVFTPEDSGTAEAPVIYAAYPRETPVLSAGRPVTGWTRTTVNGTAAWMAPLDWRPAAKDPDPPCRQLFVNGRRADRTRLPAEGFYRMAEVPDVTKDTPWNHGQKRFRFAAGEMKAWKNISDVEVVALHFWVDSRLPLVSVDEAGRTATAAKKSIFRLSDDYQNRPPRYYVENVVEALGAPGTWYWDRAAKAVTYVPRPGEDPAKAEAIVPQHLHVLRLEGRPGEKRFVEHLRFRGLTFAHALDFAPAPGWPSADVCGPFQSAFTAPGAITMAGARECAIEDGAVVHTGSYGIELGEGCQGIRIVGNTIADLGAGGIKIGETAFRREPERQTLGNTVTDNTICDGGRIFHSACGIWVAHSAKNRFAHNHIHHFYYSGFSIGWSWGYGESGAFGNIVEFNDVHDLGQRYLNDMGGVYTLGVSPGTVIRNNVFRDILSDGYGGWGIYFDEGTTGVVAENNVVYRCKSNSFHQHYGKENLVRNNILALAHDAQIARSRKEPHLSFTLERNLVFWREGQLLSGNWEGEGYKLDLNLYWLDAKGGGGAKPETLKFAQWPLPDWQKRGQDVRSIVADPLFVDPDKGNFALRPGSPALKLGFKPIDVSKVGPRPCRERK